MIRTSYLTQGGLGRTLAGLSAFGLLAAPVAASAQAAGSATDAVTGNTLNLPENITMLSQNNPDLRKATAMVNGAVITGTDVDQRVALVASTSEGEIPEAEMQRLRQQILRNLIDETLQIQEAAAQEMPVSDEEVDQRYNRLAAQNFGTQPEKMDEYLASVGSSAASLKRQIRGELAWQRLISRNVSPFINVAEEEVNEMLQRLEASRGTEEYRLGEIFLSATSENATAVEQNALRIIEQLRQGGSFVAYARQFSEASTAAVGGDLGFVRLGQLPSELAAVAKEMQPGQLVGPIAIPGGLSILYLIDRKQVLMADPRDALLTLKQISISFAPGSTQEQASGRVAEFATAVQSIRGCGDAERAAQTIGAEVVENQIRVRALPEQLQQTMLDLQIGQASPAFGSVEDGVRVLLLCGRDDPQEQAGPDFNTLMSQLEDERVNKRAQRYLRDLRNDALIQYN
ncbi:peptidylprolyl isomerase [Alteripontixanthobacter muriae]|uniref:peptidylprolyl isomerase n=1 Tax=Alteripontixanthobacter muriae TaxID=2705546 RepID=UPI002FC3DB37